MIPESLWSSDTDAGVEQQAEYEQAGSPEPREEVEPHAGGEAHQQEAEAAAPSVALAVSADEFSALEERVQRAVDILRRERQARAQAEVRISEAEERAVRAEEQLSTAQAQLNEQTPLVEQLQNEVHGLRTERDTVRRRVERLLEQLDSLEI